MLGIDSAQQRNTKETLLRVIDTQELTIDESEIIKKEIKKNEEKRTDLVHTKNQKASLKFKLSQTLEDLINEVSCLLYLLTSLVRK